MKKTLEENLHRLVRLSETAQNPKIAPEERVSITNEAFQLENKILTEIDVEEKGETDIKTVQNLYDIRENVWDIVGKITKCEENAKAKASKKASKESLAGGSSRSGKKPLAHKTEKSLKSKGKTDESK